MAEPPWLVISWKHDRETIRTVMPEEIDPADLAALEQLVRYGLADVVTINGEPHYTRLVLVSPGLRRSRRLEPETSPGSVEGANEWLINTLAPRR
jgi:hypothetical protein